MKFDCLVQRILKESRWSDAEYRNPHAAWRLTVEEYLQQSNKKEKFHSLEAYEPRETKVLDSIGNPIQKVEIEDSYEKGWKKICWYHEDGRGDCRLKVSPLEVSTEEGAKNYALQHSEHSNLKFKITKQYFWENNKEYDLKTYPYKIETLKNGIEIRYRKKPYLEIAAFDSEKIIGIALDEWGALLIQVSEKYRNQGIGKVLSRIYNSINPKDSGGFTPSGLSMKKSLHREAVKQAQEKGWYEKAIKEGILTPEKVKEILFNSGRI